MAIATSLAEAKQIGVKKYYPIKSCKHGHDSPYYVVNASCVECTQIKHKKYRDKNGAKWAATRRKKYAEDKEYRDTVTRKNKDCRNRNKEKYNESRREKYKNDPEYREKHLAARRGRDQRDSQLKTNYGITKADYDKLLDIQLGLCAICGEEKEETLSVDHCHTTKKIRGLLCRKCNTGLGCYNDDIALINKAIKYLENNLVD